MKKFFKAITRLLLVVFVFLLVLGFLQTDLPSRLAYRITGKEISIGDNLLPDNLNELGKSMKSWFCSLNVQDAFDRIQGFFSSNSDSSDNPDSEKKNLISEDTKNTFLSLFSSEPSEVKDMRKKELILNSEGHIEYYFQQLTDAEKRAYREMIEGVEKREEGFYLTISSEEELNRTYHAVIKDHPELFWIHNKEDVYRTTYGNSDYCLFNPAYIYTDEEIAEVQRCMEQAYQEVRSQLSANADDYEIVKTVYTYIIDQTDYVVSEHDQNIAGVFWKKNAVCAGYAGAVQYLLERFGVPCIYVDGSVKDRTEGHAWNIVELDGNYYYVDATNGDQPEFLIGDAAILAEHKTTLMDYCCPFPEEYESNYFATDEFYVPQCTATARNFYVMNNGCFSQYDRQTIYNYCCMRADNNAAVIRFKFSNEEAFRQAYAEWIDGDAVKDLAQYYMQIHNLYQVQYHYGVLEDLRSIYFVF